VTQDHSELVEAFDPAA